MQYELFIMPEKDTSFLVKIKAQWMGSIEFFTVMILGQGRERQSSHSDIWGELGKWIKAEQ